ncbi:MAG: hypothetical protein MSB12_00645 [Lentisphaeraceae bacterium]|nr:hypothetical protein [Lentisphaeraceae bacterium]
MRGITRTLGALFAASVVGSFAHGANEVISINIAGTRANNATAAQANVPDTDDNYGLAAVPGKAWFNTGLLGTAAVTELKMWDPTTSSVLPAYLSFRVAGKNLWTLNNSDTTPTVRDGSHFLVSYIDDGSTPTIEIGNIPFSAYKVYIYAATDSTDFKFGPVTVNGTKYTYSTESGTTITTTAADSDAQWGTSRNTTAEVGTNALLVEGLAADTLTITGSGAYNYGFRGGLAAIQIVNTGTETFSQTVLPENWASGVSFDVPSGWTTKSVPTVAYAPTSVSGTLALETADKLRIGDRFANVAKLTSADGEYTAQVFGVNDSSRGNKSTVTRDVWLQVTGGKYNLIVGGSENHWQNSHATPLNGDIFVEMGADVSVNNVVGVAYKGGDGTNGMGDYQTFEGNALTVIKGTVRGSIVGGVTSAHNCLPLLTGNTKVRVLSVQGTNSNNLADITNCRILGGSTKMAGNWNNGASQTGDAAVEVELASDASGNFVKEIVGGSYASGGKSYAITGNTSVSISAPAGVTFIEPIYGAQVSDTATATVSGNSTVTINGGTYTNSITAGGYGANAGVAGTATLKITGGTFSSGSSLLAVKNYATAGTSHLILAPAGESALDLSTTSIGAFDKATLSGSVTLGTNRLGTAALTFADATTLAVTLTTEETTAQKVLIGLAAEVPTNLTVTAADTTGWQLFTTAGALYYGVQVTAKPWTTPAEGTNWSDGFTDFQAGDSVTFGTNAQSETVTLNAAVTAGSVEVAGAYSFTGEALTAEAVEVAQSGSLCILNTIALTGETGMLVKGALSGNGTVTGAITFAEGAKLLLKNDETSKPLTVNGTISGTITLDTTELTLTQNPTKILVTQQSGVTFSNLPEGYEVLNVSGAYWLLKTASKTLTATISGSEVAFDSLTWVNAADETVDNVIFSMVSVSATLARAAEQTETVRVIYNVPTGSAVPVLAGLTIGEGVVLDIAATSRLNFDVGVVTNNGEMIVRPTVSREEIYGFPGKVEYVNLTVTGQQIGAKPDELLIREGDTVNFSGNSLPRYAAPKITMTGGNLNLASGNTAFWLGGSTSTVNQTVNQSGGTVTMNPTSSNASGSGNGLLLGFSGGTTYNLSGGTLDVSNNFLNYWSASSMNVSGTGLLKMKGVFDGDNNANGTLTLADKGTIELTGLQGIPATALGTLTLNGGKIVAKQTTPINKAATVGGAVTLSADTEKTLTVGGALSGTGSVTVDGAGIVAFSAANTYTGGTTVKAGATVNLTGSWAGAVTVSGQLAGTGTVSGTLTFNDGATLDASAGPLTAGTVTCNGTVTVTLPSTPAAGTIILNCSKPSDIVENLTATSMPTGLKFAANEAGTAVVLATTGDYTVGDLTFETLQEALDSITSGDTKTGTITIDATAQATIELTDQILVDDVAANITLDLGGKTLSAAAASLTLATATDGAKASGVIWVRQGALTVKNGTITTDGRAIRVGVLFTKSNPVNVDPESAKLTLESTLSVESTGDYTVTAFQGAKVISAANITASGADYYALSGNGTASGTGNNNTTIEITGGTIMNMTGVALYHPQGGTLTISGEETNIYGSTALYARAGTITISGGTFGGYGPVADYDATANGVPALGDAVVIDNHSSYQALSVTITGGIFTAQHGAPIASYSNGNAAYPVRTGFVSGGKFNKAIAGSLCADGKCCVKTSGSDYYPWTIGTLSAISGGEIDTPEAKDVIGAIIAADTSLPTSVEVKAGTKSGAALPPAEVADALAIFGSSVTTTANEGSKLTITVGYDFGISEVYQDGSNIVVKAKVQKSNETNATEATISNGVTLTLVDGDGVPLEGGVKTLDAATQEVSFTIPVEKIAGKTFKVKATK